MAGKGRLDGEGLTFSERYGLPSQIVREIGDTPWETIVTMAKGFSSRVEGQSSEIGRLQKEIALERMLLAEKAREQSETGSLDPSLLVGLVRLLGKCERMAHDYQVDMRESTTYIALLIEKVKKEKMRRHEPDNPSSMSHFAPMGEGEFVGLKARSEGGRLAYGKAKASGSGKKPAGKK